MRRSSSFGACGISGGCPLSGCSFPQNGLVCSAVIPILPILFYFEALPISASAMTVMQTIIVMIMLTGIKSPLFSAFCLLSCVVFIDVRQLSVEQNFSVKCSCQSTPQADETIVYLSPIVSAHFTIILFKQIPPPIRRQFKTGPTPLNSFHTITWVLPQLQASADTNFSESLCMKACPNPIGRHVHLFCNLFPRKIP